jgi:hypothetical protein
MAWSVSRSAPVESTRRRNSAEQADDSRRTVRVSWAATVRSGRVESIRFSAICRASTLLP